MKLILLTPSQSIDNEHAILGKMLDMGLPTLHVRKPKFSTAELKSYLRRFTKEQRKKIILHNHYDMMMSFKLKGIHVSKRHRRKKFMFWLTKTKLYLRRGRIIIGTSCKSLSSLDETQKDFDYVMLTPIFSNPGGHRPSFNPGTLKRVIPTYPGKVIARGGGTLESIEKIKEIGFAGIAFHRYIWNKPNPVEAFRDILDKFRELGLTVE